jgi:predicted type IV restriction endonuclease
VDIDQAKAQFEQIYAELSQGDIHIETEQDARFQVIDRILTDVLGWKRAEIKTEPATDTGFVDYLITSEGRNILVVEAKRTSTPLVNTHKPSYGLVQGWWLSAKVSSLWVGSGKALLL